MRFRYETQRRLTAANDYIEKGKFLDANAELDEIEPEQRDDSEVLALRVTIYAALNKWDLMQTAAKILALRDPDNVQWSVSWAYATRRADSISAARLILLNALDHLPLEAIFHYNLACYECHLGDLEVAIERLKLAFTLEPRYRKKALADEDLEPLWPLLSPSFATTRRPINSEPIHKPGPDPDDLCLPSATGEKLLARVKQWIEGSLFVPKDERLFFAIYRMMGLPRAWQLGGVDELQNLSEDLKAVLRDTAKNVMTETEPGVKYLFISEPFPKLPLEYYDTMDLTDEASTEAKHWGWTMPMAFVERIAKL